MATAILSSRNSLKNRFDHETLTHRHANAAPRRRKRTPTASQSRKLVVSPAANTNLVMGQVKILKRGETLSAFRSKENSSSSCVDRDGDDKNRSALRTTDVDLVVASTNRIGPDPETVQKQIGAFKGLEIVAGKYAGTGCSVSPPPCSLPIPCFLGKNKLLV
ncbi:hypothetical protein EUTSA_v10029029mg [Eutrema salsugineum]|uniref:Uncharacterized protein n=1 Tax=Eutrema salsugineum TaxID=72664 RepID=V4MZ08_EUTSA|nr:uncharacterized protein LOC18015202 [Eutrema salsugineum]ESQ37856.1 hypothetical protein EUTSA_v10029029mg [Eutrema salsugineum]